LEGAKVNITKCTFNKFAETKEMLVDKLFPPCCFQYLAIDDQYYGSHNYSITFDKNYEHSIRFTYCDLPIMHCHWLPQSAYKTAIPLKINNKFIKYINKTGQYNALSLFT